MSWQETRGAATATVRRAAHTDDAKSRSDDASSLRSTEAPKLPVKPRPRWLVPAGITAAAVLLGGGAAAAVVASNDEPEQVARSSVAPSPTGGPSGGSPSGPAGAGATPVVAPSTSTSPSSAGDPLYFTTTGQMVVTPAKGGPQTYKASYRVDCRTGPCSVFNPITKTTVVMPSTGPNTWSLPAEPLPTNACAIARDGAPKIPRGSSTMVLSKTSVRTVSNFAGYTVRGGGCFASAAAWSGVFTGDRKPL